MGELVQHLVGIGVIKPPQGYMTPGWRGQTPYESALGLPRMAGATGYGYGAPGGGGGEEATTPVEDPWIARLAGVPPQGRDFAKWLLEQEDKDAALGMVEPQWQAWARYFLGTGLRPQMPIAGVPMTQSQWWRRQQPVGGGASAATPTATATATAPSTAALQAIAAREAATELDVMRRNLALLARRNAGIRQQEAATEPDMMQRWYANRWNPWFNMPGPLP
uniref:Uncharacterized protein n=2 Tax=viral metagenome TaxID=1070528 RepID=A0A6H1ZK07_9ZZZZ